MVLPVPAFFGATLTQSNSTDGDSTQSRPPSRFWTSVSLACFLLLMYFVCITTVHAVYHSFPAHCPGSGPASCSGLRLTTIILSAIATYFLAAIAVMIGSYFTADLRHHSRIEYAIASFVVILTFTFTLLEYSNVKEITRTAGYWDLNVLAVLMLASGGAIALAATIAYQYTRDRFHPIRRYRALKRRRHA